MKKRNISILLVLCILLAGCTSTADQAQQLGATVQTETASESAEATVIRPLPDTTMETLQDSIVHISFEQDSFSRDASGSIFLRMKIYSYDRFDMVDISAMKAGDTIIVSGEEIPVTAVERNDHGTVLVNGGLENGGFDLANDDGGVYFVHGYDDMKSWNSVGEAECPVSDSFVFTDSVDLEKEPVAYSAADMLEGIPGAQYGFQPQNTTVRLENGQVVTMERIYTP